MRVSSGLGGEDLRLRGDPAEDRVRLHRGTVCVQPRHAVLGGLQHDPPLRQRPLMPLGERHRPDRLDQRAQFAAERAHRVRLGELDRGAEQPVAELRLHTVQRRHQFASHAAA